MTAAGAPEPALIPRRVARAERIATDIHLFELRDPAGADLPEFSPGSHVTLRVPNGMLRRYSLCNDPAERDRYVVAVKREANGRGGSESLIRDGRVGSEIAVSGPVNNFALAKAAGGHLFVAGGIGITPIMAMIRHLAAAGGRFRLYYCTRAPEATAFRAELAEFGSQVVIHHDGGDLARALDLWPILEKPQGRQLYCCGPRGLMQAVRDMTGHWSPAAVHFESFADAAPRPDDKPFTVRLARNGDIVTVPVGTTILAALRAHGLAVPSSCESGTCGTCRTKLLAGEADHRDLVLADGERATTIMLCVSRALSDELVIDR
ncbi:MAG TPA: PDR/VanB family oxidoreductase [Xanthobacteraceae bacterium]|nr:PDR/VanB family oxidoreductase [Xanthobacteraceae bacterium]